ncbi:hypothetical protein DIE14_21980 [Burkholderia sp. Bp9017]|uniref:hypothetical protein n=1 Tax=unclassified Burkholderia TaxID=2613784 RepID=UPI000F5F4B0F|nr:MULTISPECIES: hypothetical protein [unclassified Burkholderia]RQZ24182.1 hypothetical protein DIE14_21980 [Burkholderia sp. Bp9017]RQZ32152.1 hypothetical protein DIE13_21860 [Burkholderia sp. Bp9016]
MKPIFDAHGPARRAALQELQKSHFPPAKPIESSAAWRLTIVAALVVIFVNLVPGNDVPAAPAVHSHARPQV